RRTASPAPRAWRTRRRRRGVLPPRPSLSPLPSRARLRGLLAALLLGRVAAARPPVAPRRQLAAVAAAQDDVGAVGGLGPDEALRRDAQLAHRRRIRARTLLDDRQEPLELGPEVEIFEQQDVVDERRHP